MPFGPQMPRYKETVMEAMMNGSLLEGLEVITVICASAVVLMPLLVWVLPDRVHAGQEA